MPLPDPSPAVGGLYAPLHIPHPFCSLVMPTLKTDATKQELNPLRRRSNVLTVTLPYDWHSDSQELHDYMNYSGQITGGEGLAPWKTW